MDIKEKIALVFQYTDILEKGWLDIYSNVTGGDTVICQYGYGTEEWVRYMLRSVAVHMPFIGDIYMITPSEAHIPGWMDNIHEDGICFISPEEFIPDVYLPCLNPRTAEMFLGNIDVLPERFIYVRTGAFALRDMTCDMFFDADGLPVQYWPDMTDTYDMTLCRELTGGDRKGCLNPYTAFVPCLKSTFLEMSDVYGERIYSHMSQTLFQGSRTPTVMLMACYQYLTYAASAHADGWTEAVWDGKDMADDAYMVKSMPGCLGTLMPLMHRLYDAVTAPCETVPMTDAAPEEDRDELVYKDMYMELKRKYDAYTAGEASRLSDLEEMRRRLLKAEADLAMTRSRLDLETRKHMDTAQRLEHAKETCRELRAMCRDARADR